MALATLDFELFTKGDEVQRRELSDALTESFRDHGFAKLVNHGVPPHMVRKLFAIVSWSHSKQAIHCTLSLINNE
jgi:isopenicillin N synthase-like dioxygenase